ncbi:double zinc ribbon domain-containing protein [Chloroflexus sp.]|uniref:double zinc ribbon domain-containing protein n=2 Tax=Chloroflexus sp. TaxID=1904827 RepID=UPI002ACD40FF|nr:zinc ribbon domain-containing protein [Chloroflexus sp.]
MIICPSCGAQNEATNRFCDQCGTRLAGAAPAAPAPTTVSPDQPTALAPSCPVCGTTVLPGERFCDNCGADLMATPVTTPTTPDQATLVAPPSTPQLFCPDCSDPVLPGERFCDNCGADLSKLFDSASAANAPTVIAPPLAADAPTVIAPPPAADAPTVIAPPPAAEPVAEPLSPVIVEAPAAPAAPAEGTTMIAPPAPPVAEPAAPPPVETPVAEPAALPPVETPVAEPAAPPPVETPTAAPVSPVAAPAIDLAAERARLETLLAAHRDTVAQYEQMAARYPAGSVPAFITAGLDAARAELAKTEAELAALTGNALAVPTTVAAAAAAHPAAPTPIATPIPAKPPATARLVLADGSEIELPPGKHEYIIGREDPVSNIFPEIDLTPYGGETGGVSRQHAKIVHTGNQWSIVDLNSTNHTRVNGTRIEPQTPVPISDGTKLQFGRLVATFHIG